MVIRPKRINVLVSRTPSAISQPGVEHSVEVAPQRLRVDVGKRGPPTPQHVERQRCAPETNEFSDGSAVTGDRQALPTLGTIDHVTAMVPQVTNRHAAHAEGWYPQ